MFNSSYFEWCDLWEEEVGIVYDKTWEARIVPVRRVDIHGPRPDDLKQIGRVVFTPTFVLIDNGRELGRINGYPGEGHFWSLLDEIVNQMPIPHRACDENRKVTSDETKSRTGPKLC